MRRALVIGAETSGLAGADNDARDVAAWLRGCGFSVDLRIGGAATRDAILDGFGALVADTGPDDAAAVYFGGHGGLLEPSDLLQARLGFLVPTDHEHGGRFRGIVEPEWSALVAALTAQTQNVTVIHDCCHAAQTVRDARLPGGRVRALAPLRIASDDLRSLIDRVRGDEVHPLGNPHAVRITAAAGRGLAWERADAAGRVQGVFTAALVAEASAPRDRAASWAELGRRVRDRVLQAIGRQRPEIEGPIDRCLFELDTLDLPRRIAVRPEGRRFVLSAGSVHGVERGDVFRSATSADQVALVTHVGVFESVVHLAEQRGRSRTLEVVAARRATRYSTAIEASDPELRTALAAAVADAPRLCVGDAPHAIALIQHRHGQLEVLDEHGPICSPLAVDGAAITQVVTRLSRIAAARALQRTTDELHDPERLAMTVERVSGQRGWLNDGAELHLADRMCLHVANRTQRTLWLHCLVIGPGLEIDALGPVSSGTPLEPRSTEILGAVPGRGSVGFTLRWPADTPAAGTRPVELIAIATTAPVDLSSVAAPALAEAIAPAPSASRDVGSEHSLEASRDVRTAPRAQYAVAARRRLVLRP